MRRYPFWGNDLVDEDYYFSRALRSRIKFALAFLLFSLFLVVLFWNLQPWYQIEVKFKKVPSLASVTPARK